MKRYGLRETNGIESLRMAGIVPEVDVRWISDTDTPLPLYARFDGPHCGRPARVDHAPGNVESLRRDLPARRRGVLSDEPSPPPRQFLGPEVRHAPLES